jgi:hypothetical protein
LQAHVCAAQADDDPSRTPTTTCIDTSPAGVYAIFDLEPGHYAVTAEAEGFVAGATARSATVSLGPGDAKQGIDIALDPGGVRISGIVVDATGGPVEGALIRPTTTPGTRSGRDGRFFIWLPAGPVSLSAEAVGYAPSQREAFAPSDDVVLTLIPGSSVSGQVVDAADGTPAANIDVRVVPEGNWGSVSRATTRTAADGTFTLHGLLPGRSHVLAEGEGRRGQTAPFDVGLLDSLDHLVVKVSSAAAVSGHVSVRSRGAPCPRGSVALGPASNAPSPDEPPTDPEALPAASDSGGLVIPSLTANIDGSGGVHLRAVPAGVYHVVVRCAGYRWADGPRTVRVGASNVDGLSWTVEQGLSLVVHVTDGAHRPVPNAPFRLLWPPRSSDQARAAMSLAVDAGAQYEVLGSLHPGVYTLEPAGGYAGERVDVELRDGMGEVDATLLLAGQGSLVVNVVTSGGVPVDDVTVTAMPVKGTTIGSAPFLSAARLSGGRFRAGPLAPGRYTYRVSDGMNAAGGSTDGVEVSDGATVERTVILDRGGRIRGRVVDSAMQPVPDAWVRSDCTAGSGPRTPGEIALLQGASPYARRAPVLSDLEGSFDIGDLSGAGRCSLQAVLADGSSGVARDVRVGDTRVIVTLASLVAPQGTQDAEPKGAAK